MTNHETEALLARLTSQGINPGAVFSNNNPAIYALAGGYDQQSQICATIAAAHLDGLEAIDVLDIGPGYGTTTAEILKWNPDSITAVDSSAAMLTYMRLIYESNEDVEGWLRHAGVDQILEPLGLFPQLVAKLQTMRKAYELSMFRNQEGKLTILESNVLNADAVLPLQAYDVIIGNNFFHWPVQQELARLRQESNASPFELIPQAVSKAIAPLKRLLSREGVMVLMEPADFIVLDNKPELDRYIEENAMQAHPLFVRIQERVNQILLNEHRITRQPAKRAPLFKQSQLKELMLENGLSLVQRLHIEASYTEDPRMVFIPRLPLHLASVDLPFENKSEILQRIIKEIQGPLSEAEQQPVRPHWFYLVLEHA